MKMIINNVRNALFYRVDMIKGLMKMVHVFHVNLIIKKFNLVDHVDISLLNDFEVGFPARYSNAYTLSFWSFVSDESPLGEEYGYKISIDGLMSIMIGKKKKSSSSSSSSITENGPGRRRLEYYQQTDEERVSSMCITYSSSYQAISKIDDFKEMLKYYDNPNYMYSMKVVTFENDISGKWAYNRCGFSIDSQKMYNYISIDYDDPIILTNDDLHPLLHSSYFDRKENTIDYKNFFSDNIMKIKIHSYSLLQASTKIYLKAVNVFSDMIPIKAAIEYYDFSKLQNNNDFPSLLAALNLDTFNLWSNSTNSQTANCTYVYFTDDGVSNTRSVDLFLRDTSYPSTDGDYTAYIFKFTAYKYLYRLNLIDVSTNKNKYFSTPDLKVSEMNDLHCSGFNFSYCWDGNRGINCLNNYYYNMVDEVCENTCQSGLLPNFGSIVGEALTTGYCTFDANLTQFDYQSFDSL